MKRSNGFWRFACGNVLYLYLSTASTAKRLWVSPAPPVPPRLTTYILSSTLPGAPSAPPLCFYFTRNLLCCAMLFGGRVRNYPRCPIPVAKLFQTSGRTIEEKLWAGMKIPYSLVGPVLPNTEELISRPLLGLLKDPIAAPGPYENQEC